MGFDIAYDKAPERIQKIVDNAPNAEAYATGGYLGYADVVCPGKHIRNICDKSDTFTVEGVNADLRHYIPTLVRRSWCFARTIETLTAVTEVFIEAYDRFGIAKQHFYKHRTKGKPPFGLVDFL